MDFRLQRKYKFRDMFLLTFGLCLLSLGLYYKFGIEDGKQEETTNAAPGVLDVFDQTQPETVTNVMFPRRDQNPEAKKIRYKVPSQVLTILDRHTLPVTTPESVRSQDKEHTSVKSGSAAESKGTDPPRAITTPTVIIKDRSTLFVNLASATESSNFGARPLPTNVTETTMDSEMSLTTQESNGSETYNGTVVATASERQNKTDFYAAALNATTATRTARKSGKFIRCNIPPLTDLEQFFSYGKKEAELACTNLAEMGGRGRFPGEEIWPYNEGSRMVCLDTMKDSNCTVLSFGVRNDFTFEDMMESDVDCKIYSFDPATSMKTHQHSKNVWFFDFGIGDAQKAIEIKGSYYQLFPYDDILKMINLSDKKIDFLKIDIDLWDIVVLNDLLKRPHLLRNVDQIGMELHPVIHREYTSGLTVLEAFRIYWEAMHRLECLGYQLISFIPNTYSICSFIHNNRNVSGCYDVVYIRIPNR